jgi:hypothetical protein
MRFRMNKPANGSRKPAPPVLSQDALDFLANWRHTGAASRTGKAKAGKPRPSLPVKRSAAQSREVKIQIPPTRALKALGVDINEGLLKRLKLLAAKGAAEDREYRMMREIVEAALERFVDQLERKWGR